MDTELKVTCSRGATQVVEGELVYLSSTHELRQPANWSAWRPEGRYYGKIPIGGGDVRYSINVIVPAPKLFRLEVTMEADITHPAPAVAKPCFGGSGSGEKVVGTWIAEGGG